MELQVGLTTEQKVLVTVTPKSASGNPAPVEGQPSWSVQQGDVIVEPAADGLSATISAGLVGTSIVAINADADLGPDQALISSTVVLTVAAPVAVNLELVAGAPEPK